MGLEIQPGFRGVVVCPLIESQSWEFISRTRPSTRRRTSRVNLPGETEFRKPDWGRGQEPACKHLLRAVPTHHRQPTPTQHAPPQTRCPPRPLRPPRDRSLVPPGMLNRPVREVAVISRTALPLIRRDEQIELTLRQPNQISVLHPTPPSLLGGGAFVASEQTAHRPRNALIQKDPHAVRRADSDRSRSWQAIWRVTDGKHSRNSSNV